MIINTIPATDCTPQTIVIGRRGTYDTMQIAFDLSYLVESYGNGVAVLAVKRSQDESAYPAIVTQEDETLLWIVNETDTAYVGSGECQLMWYVDGGLAKTIIYPMVVMRDILQTAEQPPDGYENWIEHLTELGAKTQQNAQNAAQSASDASTAKDDAVTAKEAAEAAQEAAETAVTHYPVIINGYWNVWSVETQTYVSTGIKAKGEDGYSPEVTITTITGGHRVTITDKDHPTGQSFDVLDGQGGGGSSDYATLSNKPKINNVELDGNKTAHDLGLAAQTDIPTVPVQSVNGKTGAVNLASGDIAYDESATYQDGSVGAELQEQNRQLSDLEDSISDAYDATASYAVGDFCINENTLYRCNTAIPTGGEVWTAAHWDAVQITDFLGSGSGGDVTDVQINGTSILSGGVANIPVAGTNQYGVVRSYSELNGVVVNASGYLSTVPADSNGIKNGSSTNCPIAPSRQHESTFYGLAKAAGDTTQKASSNAVGAYTEDAKSAIHEMLNGAVTVSGTTPTIVAKSGITYVCGEVATLDITLPASGIFEVQFVSGSTPTVLTATGVSWVNGFDPTALEANKTYDISISNGIGVAVWI